jgi:hypothetical protein
VANNLGGGSCNAPTRYQGVTRDRTISGRDRLRGQFPGLRTTPASGTARALVSARAGLDRDMELGAGEPPRPFAHGLRSGANPAAPNSPVYSLRASKVICAPCTPNPTTIAMGPPLKLRSYKFARLFRAERRRPRFMPSLRDKERSEVLTSRGGGSGRRRPQAGMESSSRSSSRRSVGGAYELPPTPNAAQPARAPTAPPPWR